MKREFLEGLRVGEQGLPREVVEAILAENGRELQAAELAAGQWQSKYTQAVAAHEKQLADMAFTGLLQEAIAAARGRSVKAITALLDVEALKGSEDRRGAVEAALQKLKKDSGYLFEPQQTPPPYARGTGAGTGAEYERPATLAGALRERFEKVHH